MGVVCGSLFVGIGEGLFLSLNKSKCNVFQTVTLRPFQQHFLLVDFVIIISLRLGQPSLSAFTVFSN